MSTTRLCLAQLVALAIFALSSIASAQSWNTSQDLPWSKPGNSPAVFHNGRFFIVSGDDGIWSSIDGTAWKCVLRNPSWAPRKEFTVASFQGKIYVMGGRNAFEFYNDVWSSTDGVTWNHVTTGANWTARGLGSAIVFNNRLWLIGGFKMTLAAGSMIAADYQYFSEVWSTSDGSTWQSAGTISWAGRAMPGVAIFNNQLCMVGGLGVTNLHDVWVSDNGTNWTQKTSSAPFGDEWSMTAASLGGKLWALGGLTQKTWSSTNGTDWTEAAAPWPSAWGQSSIVSGGQLYTIAGAEATDSTAITSKVWRTGDGASWTHVGGDKQIWSPRTLHRTIEFNGSVWLIGGLSADNHASSESAQVWRANIVSSAFGPTISGWDLVTRSAPWRGRWGHGALSYAGKMWILGGCDDARSFSDVWSSTDGSSWTLVTGNAWPKRAYHGCLVYDNKMWVICGTSRPDSQGDNADVYYSTNGIDWTQTTANAPFAARRGMGVVSFGGKLWVIGGARGTTFPSCSESVYSTTDGITWEPYVGYLPFDRQNFATAVFDGKIWIYGGGNWVNLYNDVWSSTDGFHWISEGTAPWSARRGASALFFNNSTLLLMGGNAYENLNDVWAIQYKNGAEKAWMKLQ